MSALNTTGICKCINPLPNDKIIDWFKLKQITDNSLKFI